MLRLGFTLSYAWLPFPYKKMPQCVAAPPRQVMHPSPAQASCRPTFVFLHLLRIPQAILLMTLPLMYGGTVPKKQPAAPPTPAPPHLPPPPPLPPRAPLAADMSPLEPAYLAAVSCNAASGPHM